MKKEEFRIGNYVQDKEGVFKITPTFFNLLELNLKTTKPIPLTEEWLLKFGFYENRNHNPSWQLDVKLGFSILGRIGKQLLKTKTTK